MTISLIIKKNVLMNWLPLRYKIMTPDYRREKEKDLVFMWERNME